MGEYQKSTKQILKSISDIVVEWCKIITSDAGCVSDNYLGYVRIIRWSHHPISMLVFGKESEERHIGPEIEPKYWYDKMWRDWLKLHEVQFDGTIP